MARENIERQNQLEPKRIDFAKNEITKLGYEITHECEKELRFEYNGQTVYFFPYSGWFQGKSVKAGRGIKKLLKQIEK